MSAHNGTCTENRRREGCQHITARALKTDGEGMSAHNGTCTENRRREGCQHITARALKTDGGRDVST